MRANDYKSPNQIGFSLIELMVTLVVFAILITIATASYYNFITQKRLRIGTEDLYNYIRAAYSQSLNKQSSLYLSFNPGATWCYGLNDGASCDCSVSGSCTVNGIDTVVQSSSYSGEAMSLSVTGFSGAASNPYIWFQGNQGTVSDSGSATFSLSGLTTVISTNKQGLVSICSNNLSGYQTCP